jgi:hypothetical protein
LAGEIKQVSQRSSVVEWRPDGREGDGLGFVGDGQKSDAGYWLERHGCTDDADAKSLRDHFQQ